MEPPARSDCESWPDDAEVRKLLAGQTSSGRQSGPSEGRGAALVALVLGTLAAACYALGVVLYGSGTWSEMSSVLLCGGLAWNFVALINALLAGRRNRRRSALIRSAIALNLLLLLCAPLLFVLLALGVFSAAIFH